MRLMPLFRAIFLSTPSARRATLSQTTTSTLQMISIHALREEGDLQGVILHGVALDFYPRPPRGGRRRIWLWNWLTWIFLSTPSARRATDRAARGHKFQSISIHALREEGDRLAELPPLAI